MGAFYRHFCNLSVLACCHFLHPAPACLIVNGVPVLLKLMKQFPVIDFSHQGRCTQNNRIPIRFCSSQAIRPAQTNLGDLVDSYVIDFSLRLPLSALQWGDFWLSWQLWRLINSTPGSSAVESGPEDENSTKCMRKKRWKSFHLFAHLAPLGPSHLTRMPCITRSGQFWMNNFFFFHSTPESGVHCICHLYSDRGQLRLYFLEGKFPPKVETLGSITKC